MAMLAPSTKTTPSNGKKLSDKLATAAVTHHPRHNHRYRFLAQVERRGVFRANAILGLP
jgi:hypothetical protein